MGQPILIVEDDIELLDSMGEFVETICGGEALKASSLDHLKAEAGRLNGCRLAILDINLGAGKPSGLDVQVWLRENNFKGKVVFLTGHAKGHPLVQKAQSVGDAVILEKPVSVQTLSDLVDQEIRH